MKQKLQNALTLITQALDPILSVIAVLVIFWTNLSFFDKMNEHWTLPLIAITTGLSSVLLPLISKRVTLFYAIISTGLSLLAISIYPYFVPEELQLIALLLTVIIISVLTDCVVSEKMTVGLILFDIAVSIIAGILIYFFNTVWISTIILGITFVLVLLIGYDFSFSLKKVIRKSAKSVNIPNTTNNVG